MSTPAGFTSVRCSARLADLAFRYVRPDDWVEAELPFREIDFSESMECTPLAACRAPHAALEFSVEARPAFAGGSVAQWLDSLLRAQDLAPSPLELEELDAHRAVATWVIALGNEIPVRQRILAFEDGGRLLLLRASAPRDLWASAEVELATMLRSFALERPQGPTAALALPELPLASASFAAMQRIEGGIDGAGDAFADEPDALDPDHPMNQRLRDAGVGLVPRVVERDEERGTAKLGVGSLSAFVHLPTGWHALEDGRRLLVFDGPGSTQINVRRFARAGQADEEILSARLGVASRTWPALQHLRIELEGLPCLGLRNFEVEGERVEQVYMLRAINEEELFEARVTSTPSSIGDALEIAHPLLLGAEVLPAA